jgi:hypothetical protein
MSKIGRSFILAAALATTTMSMATSASAYSHGSGYSCKRYCSSWGWSGWGHNKERVCKVWSCR